MWKSKITTVLLVSLMVIGLFSSVVSAYTTCTVTLSAQPHGSVSWHDNTPPLPSWGYAGTFNFHVGDTIQFNANPDSGYQFMGWYLYTPDGKNFAQSFNANIAFEIKGTAWTITAHFAVATQLTYQITGWPGSHSNMQPLGISTYYPHTSQVYVYAADSGYQVTGVTVDGNQVPVTGSYTFSDITSNHVIQIFDTAIPESNYLVTFVNDTHGGLTWVDEGVSPVPPETPYSGGDGTYGFPQGEKLLIFAYPDSVHGYVFDNFTVTGDSLGTANSTTSPMWFTVGAGATITAYFDYVPATTYDVVVSSTEGGSFTWVDNTTLASGGVGSYSFAVGDRLTFYASPYAGYYFHGIYATRYLINGVSDQPSVSFILGAAVNISAAFSLSSQNYSVAVSISPTPYGEVNASTTTFQLKDGVDYTFTFTVTSNFGPIGIGQFNVSETNVYNTIPPIFDISAAMGGSYNGLPIAALPIISIAHTPESNYGYALLNQPFSNGVFSFNITGAPVRYYEQYQGLEVTVYSSIDGSNFNSPMYALQWFYPEDLPATPTPAPGTTPTPTSSPYTHTIDFGLGTFNGYIMLMIGAIFTFLSILIFMKAFKVWVVGTMFLIVGLLMMSVSFPDLYGLVAWSIESIICTVFLYQAKEKRSK